jgi:hypothetical protein
MVVRPVNKLTQIILLGLAAVMLLPVYGSWVDDQFAARQPNHKHIYFGKVDINHHRTADSKDVVNLPDQDAAGQTAVSIHLTNNEITTQPVDPDNLSFRLTADLHAPETAFLPPPDHPPRT